MASRYRCVLSDERKINIPFELCNGEKLQLRKGTPVKQVFEHKRIVVYIPLESDAALSGADCMGEKGSLALHEKCLNELGVAVGDPLYVSSGGDLLFIETACCENCNGTVDLIEYENCNFMCRYCVAAVIRRDKERRK